MNKLFKFLCASICLVSFQIMATTPAGDESNTPLEEIDAVEFFSFSCVLPEDQSVHRFQALGYVGVNKEGVAQGTISLQLIKGNEIRSVLQFNDVSALGTFEHFEDGENSGFHILNLSTNIPYIRNISLMFKNAPLASSVLSIDYFNYRSDCKIIR